MYKNSILWHHAHIIEGDPLASSPPVHEVLTMRSSPLRITREWWWQPLLLTCHLCMIALTQSALICITCVQLLPQPAGGRPHEHEQVQGGAV